MSEKKRLPTTEEMTGAYPDLTGGMTTAEYMESIRGCNHRPFDVDKVAEEIANDVSGILRAKYMTRAVKMRIAAIINRAINGG
jgi:hypothetical protein